MTAGEALVSVRRASFRRAPHALARTLAHEVPMAAVMLAAGAAGAAAPGGGAGPGAAASCGGALALAVLSFAYARAARRSAFAREHLVDLWAMVIAMVGMAFAAAPAAGAGSGSGGPHRHLAAVAAAPLSGALLVAAVGGWLLGRTLLARRDRGLHTLVSAVVCGGMLATMVAL